MNTRYIFSLLLVLLSLNTQAQLANVWAFGKMAGINFNANPPTAIKTAISTSEGCSAMCDAQGNLLFYTDGSSIWDRKHNYMPNGDDLLGRGLNITSSTSQGALIIPVPGNENQYYVFSLGKHED